jgi:PAS domain S-box-containing protein
MAWQGTPYTVPLIAAACISAGLLAVTYRSREKRGALPLTGVLFAAFLWSTVDAVKLATTNRALKILMNDVRFLGPIIATVAVLLFAAAYTNRDEWLTRRRIAAMSAFHVVTFLLVWTNPLHHFVRQDVALTDATGFVMMEIQWGPWYYLHALYSYTLLVIAALMLVDKLRTSGDTGPYRGQVLTMLVAMAVPWGMNAAFIARLTTTDLTAIGFTVTGGMFVVAVLRYQMFDLVPIARSTVVDNIDEGYLVLDTEDTVVDVNEKATDIVGYDRESIVGLSLPTVFRKYPQVLDSIEGGGDTREQIRLGRDGETYFYDVDVSPIHDARDRLTGRVIIFHDITEQERRKQQLEQQKTRLERQKQQLEHQNERLDDFASIVSHDLRNPISVVKGRLELARLETSEEEHFEKMAAGIDRMEAIIDDVLAVARQGKTVDETERLSLSSLAEDAWMNVDAPEATLTVETDRVVDGDPRRLLQVFENFFRNALDHGRPDVTITVGDIENGFYVEDDGPGIPEDKRDQVLEKGYTTANDGTGLGLSIVQSAVEAHGWVLSIADGSDGGARFGIIGLQSPVETDALAQD